MMPPALSQRQRDFVFRLGIGAALTCLFFPFFGDSHPWMIAGFVFYPAMIGLSLLAFYKLPPSDQQSKKVEPLAPQEQRRLRLIKLTNPIPIFWTCLLAFSLLATPYASENNHTVARKEAVQKHGRRNITYYAYTLFDTDNKEHVITQEHYSLVIPGDRMQIIKASPLPLTTKLSIFRDDQFIVSDRKDYNMNMALLGAAIFFCLSPYTKHLMPHHPKSFPYGMRRGFAMRLRLFMHCALAVPLIVGSVLLVTG